MTLAGLLAILAGPVAAAEPAAFDHGAVTERARANVIVHGYEKLERRLRQVIGFGRTRRRARPILWRSRLGMVLIHANLEGALAAVAPDKSPAMHRLAEWAGDYHAVCVPA